jgi:hypothetical protein
MQAPTATDFRGVALKEELVGSIRGEGHEVVDSEAAIDSARWPRSDCMHSMKAIVRKIALILLLGPGPLLADEVFLKGGGKFTGRITAQDEERITVDIGDGSIGFSMERVDHIVKGLAPLDEYDARASKLGPQDVDGWRTLAQWATSKGLSRQSRLAYDKVLAVAPDDAAARQALGFVQFEGRWLTEEESFRARGFVKYEGEWMTPAEVQVAQSTAAAEQARLDAERRAMDAEAAAAQAQRQADEANKRALQAQDQLNNNPVYWGGFGYGPTAWPSAGGPVTRPPVDRPPVQRQPDTWSAPPPTGGLG